METWMQQCRLWSSVAQHRHTHKRASVCVNGFFQFLPLRNSLSGLLWSVQDCSKRHGNANYFQVRIFNYSSSLRVHNVALKCKHGTCKRNCVPNFCLIIILKCFLLEPIDLYLKSFLYLLLQVSPFLFIRKP